MFDFINDIVKELTAPRRKPNSRPFCEEMTEIQSMYRNESEAHYSEIKRKILAEERMESETNPVLKKRMKTLIDNGIYDFSEIDKW